MQNNSSSDLIENHHSSYSSSEDDDDLPNFDIFRNSTQTSLEDSICLRRSPTDQGNVSFNQKYTLTIEKIMESRNLQKTANDLLKNNHINNDVEIGLSRSTEETVKIESEEEYLEEKVIEFNSVPKSVIIFKEDRLFCFFNQENVNLECCGYGIKTKKTFFEQSMHETPPSVLSKILPSYLSMYQPSSISNHKAFFLFIFKVMAVNEYVPTVKACQQFIEHLMETSPNLFNKCISVKDIFSIFLNFGADVRNFCPLKSLREVELTMNCVCHNLKANAVGDWIFNLSSVLNTLNKILDCGQFDDAELSDIIIMLLWISLDHKLILTGTEMLIKRCITTALEKISFVSWPLQLKLLSNTVSTFADANAFSCEFDHNVILHVLKTIPISSEQGRIFQQISSYKVLCSLLKMKEETDIAEVEMAFLLPLMQILLENFEKYNINMLFTAGLLIDLCVGYLPEADSKDLPNTLYELIKRCENKIKNRGAEIKEYFCIIACRIKLLQSSESFEKLQISDVASNSSRAETACNQFEMQTVNIAVPEIANHKVESSSNSLSQLISSESIGSEGLLQDIDVENTSIREINSNNLDASNTFCKLINVQDGYSDISTEHSSKVSPILNLGSNNQKSLLTTFDTVRNDSTEMENINGESIVRPVTSQKVFCIKSNTCESKMTSSEDRKLPGSVQTTVFHLPFPEVHNVLLRDKAMEKDINSEITSESIGDAQSCNAITCSETDVIQFSKSEALLVTSFENSSLNIDVQKQSPSQDIPNKDRSIDSKVFKNTFSVKLEPIDILTTTDNHNSRSTTNGVCKIIHDIKIESRDILEPSVVPKLETVVKSESCKTETDEINCENSDSGVENIISDKNNFDKNETEMERKDNDSPKFPYRMCKTINVQVNSVSDSSRCSNNENVIPVAANDLSSQNPNTLSIPVFPKTQLSCSENELHRTSVCDEPIPVSNNISQELESSNTASAANCTLQTAENNTEVIDLVDSDSSDTVELIDLSDTEDSDNADDCIVQSIGITTIYID